MPTNTVHLHRIFRSTPEKLYRAFIEADALAKWVAPFGFTAKITHMDATVGGSFRMALTNFSTGATESFGGTYRELVPGERLCYTDVFDDPKLAGEIVVTVTFKKVLCGTELRIEQAGLPEVIPLEFCYLGWQESLLQLAQLVEHENPS